MNSTDRTQEVQRLNSIPNKKGAMGPRWARGVLYLAAIYNLAWGAWVILFPHQLFDWTGIERPNYPGIWQCVGMIVGVYGLGYGIAARDPQRHWPIVLVGLLGKVLAPIGFVSSVSQGQLPLAWGWTIVTNDLIWWIPFSAILYSAFRDSTNPEQEWLPDDRWTLAEANTKLRTNTGESLSELSQKQPLLLLIFLRHAGCTFCRETLDQLRKHATDIQRAGMLPVVVHQGGVQEGADMLRRWDLNAIPHVSDPSCRLFRAYELNRGSFWQLFGPQVWWRGFRAAILRGYGVGKLAGDGFQLGGAFVVHHNRVIKAFPHRTASDANDYQAVCPISPLETTPGR
jgi:peroxiredoxin